jgi:quinol monooxygenase YgiN
LLAPRLDPTVGSNKRLEDGMSIGVIATLKIQEGKTDEFEAFFGELAKQVRANEPGNLAYQLTRSRTEPTTYKVLEVYQDQDALTHHGGTDYFKAAGPKFGAVLAGRPEIEYLDGVG